MAGGKETPRQKMIGMMYLVLTAMLALQVSSALLEKFQLLNNSMESSSSAANKINAKTVESIREKVKEAGNRSFEVAIVNQAEEVRKLSNAMVSEIDAVKNDILTNAGGGFDEVGKIRNASEEEKVAIMMINQGKANVLKDKINGFVQQLNKLGGTNFGSLAQDGKDDPIASRNPEQAVKNFAELNFAQTPVPAALAVLSQKQSEIRRLEGEVLDNLASKVGAKDIKFDKILAMISAESNVVVAGTKFKGEMFIAASSSAITPRMSLNGAPLRIQDGKGVIEFTAQGGAYDKEGLAAKSLSGTISFPSPSGRDTTVSLKYDYKVAKPTYNIESGTTPPLFLGCKNVISVVSPALGPLWNPSFGGTTGASVSAGAKKGAVVIVPDGREVALHVNNAGNLLGIEKFRVNKVPRPRLEFYINGALVDERRGVPASMARNITVKVVPDESLVNYSPEDANYRVGEMVVNLARGSRRIDGVSISGPNGSISRLAQQASGGDRLVIEVSGVQRRNFRGEVKDAGMGTEQKVIGLN